MSIRPIFKPPNSPESHFLLTKPIQRDYAQGRRSANSIRLSFLGSIEDALVNDKELDLNFVYGSIEDKKQFVPIDGQQRLTTLFLLYYYASLLKDVTGSTVNR